MRPTMARLTEARKIAAVSLTTLKNGVSFDPKRANCCSLRYATAVLLTPPPLFL